jgi:hypothetical protein
MNVRNHIITLAEAKNRFLTYVDNNLTINDLLNLNPTANRFEIDLVYLHLLMLFRTPNDVHMFLQNYAYQHGAYATNMFVNYPLIDMHNRRNITPLHCAIIWNSNPYLIRVLYEWGADISYLNMNNVFPEEEINNLEYSNYLSNYRLSNIDPNNFPVIEGRRNANEFSQSINEIQYISGENNAPHGWQMPIRRLNNQY